jgi:hypothetical protein
VTVLPTMPNTPDDKSEPKPKGGKRPGAGRKPQPERVRHAATMVRSSEEWKAAVHSFAEWDRATSVSELIDRAVVAYARDRGYDKTFPKR